MNKYKILIICLAVSITPIMYDVYGWKGVLSLLAFWLLGYIVGRITTSIKDSRTKEKQ